MNTVSSTVERIVEMKYFENSDEGAIVNVKKKRKKREKNGERK